VPSESIQFLKRANLDDWNVVLAVIASALIFVVTNFTGYLGNYLLGTDIRFELVFILVIVLTNILPIFFIWLGFRTISPPVSFLVLFVLTGPVRLLMDLIQFPEPHALLNIPGFLMERVLFGFSMGIIGFGVSTLRNYRTTGSATILIGVLLLCLAIWDGLLKMLSATTSLLP
jgi:hypothetical protein